MQELNRFADGKKKVKVTMRKKKVKMKRKRALLLIKWTALPLSIRSWCAAMKSKMLSRQGETNQMSKVLFLLAIIIFQITHLIIMHKMVKAKVINRESAEDAPTPRARDVAAMKTTKKEKEEIDQDVKELTSRDKVVMVTETAPKAENRGDSSVEMKEEKTEEKKEKREKRRGSKTPEAEQEVPQINGFRRLSTATSRSAEAPRPAPSSRSN